MPLVAMPTGVRVFDSLSALTAVLERHRGDRNVIRSLTRHEERLAHLVAPSWLPIPAEAKIPDPFLAAAVDTVTNVGAALAFIDSHLDSCAPFSPVLVHRYQAEYRTRRAALVHSGGKAQLPVVMEELPPSERLRVMKSGYLNLLHEVARTMRASFAAGTPGGDSNVAGRLASDVHDRFGANLTGAALVDGVAFGDLSERRHLVIVVRDLPHGFEQAKRWEERGEPLLLHLRPERYAEAASLALLMPTVSSQTIVPVHGNLSVPVLASEQEALFGWGKALHATLRSRAIFLEVGQALARDVAQLPAAHAKLLVEELTVVPAVLARVAACFAADPLGDPPSLGEITGEVRRSVSCFDGREIDYTDAEAVYAQFRAGVVESAKILESSMRPFLAAGSNFTA